MLGGLLLLVAALGIYRFAVQQLNDLGDPSPSASPTLKTYRDESFGFQISYPDTWRSEECREERYGALLVSFGDRQDMLVCNSDAPVQGYVNITAQKNQSTDTQEIQNLMRSLEGAVRTDITIDGKPGVRIRGTTTGGEGPGPEAGITQIVIFTSANNTAYRLIYLDIGRQDYSALFDQVVTTFKFTK